jgi:hypothetical protein
LDNFHDFLSLSIVENVTSAFSEAGRPLERNGLGSEIGETMLASILFVHVASAAKNVARETI